MAVVEPSASPEVARRVAARVNRLVREADQAEADLARALLADLHAAQGELRRLVVDVADQPLAVALDAAETRLAATEVTMLGRLSPSLETLAGLGTALVDDALAVAGASVALLAAPLRPLVESTTAHLAVLVGAAVTGVRVRLSAQLLALASGAATPVGTARAVGIKLSGSPVFATPATRVRLAVHAEGGQLHAEAAQRRMAEVADEGVEVRKRWLWSHRPGGRPDHAAAEARYAPGSAPGPIPVDEDFTVAGHSAAYPRSAALPGSQRYGCGCRSVPVIA